MKAILVVFFLSIQSSYPNNSEIPATPERYDTVQFYASDKSNWRIKTFAQDEDVHIWSLGESEDIVSLARTNTEKHYGDVLTERYIIETEDGIEGLRRELRARGLDDHLEFPPSGAVFWTPAGTVYRTKSHPD
ncbi:MAG: hypothetical protein AB1807_10015 [Pseudomonadota bacterium]